MERMQKSSDSSSFDIASLVFLCLHCFAYVAEFGAILDFAIGGNFKLLFSMSVPLVLSGLLCTHAAWNAEPTQLTWWWGLPLRSQSPLVRWTLWAPLGFLQGVIILLAWDQYLERKNHVDNRTKDKDMWNRYHCKAVASLCEGLPALSVVVYTSWNMNYPEDAPTLRMFWPYEQHFLSVVGLCLFISSGFGIVELDFCCSKTVSQRMKKSVLYEVIHHTFRSCEVTCRTMMHVSFCVITKRLVNWWWCPFVFMNLVLPNLMVLVYGGDESSRLVRFVCCLPCAWVNIFMFVDSPYKRRAARIISFWYDIRFALEIFLLPALACAAAVWVHGFQGDTLSMILLHPFQLHPGLCGFGIFCILMYLTLRMYVRVSVSRQMDAIDIYTPCEQGQKEVVQEVMVTLGAEVRELTRSASADIDLNRADVDGLTPLMMACRRGHTEVCELLVQRGAFVSIVHKGEPGIRNWSIACWRGWTALHMAARHNHHRIIRIFANNGASQEDSQYLDAKSETPLHVAAWAGAFEAAKELVQHWPQWLSAENKHKKNPQDLAQNHRLKQLLKPSSSWFHNAEEGTTSDMGSYRPQVSSHRTSSSIEVWLSVPLHISRKRVHLRAPGLCSYVAASCGGALGRLCLITGDEEADQNEELQLSDLVPIDRMGNQVPFNQAIIGEGAFGQVFRARHRRRETLYAVKVFKTQRSQRGVSPEVARECEVGTHVRQTPHPCIVKLHMVTFDEDLGLYTLVMEFCPSNLFQQVHTANLEALSKSTHYKPMPQTLDWLGQVFLGLEHMHHRLNMLFRDLKPANVILDSALCAKLADFGSGRMGPSAGAYSFGHPAGTMGYCAPEVLGGMPHDETADLYSLGVLTWLLFTGGMPGTQPPVQPRPEVHQHLYDWMLLRKCVEDNLPAFRSVEGAEPEDARNCVHLFVQPPDRRMRHKELRAHPLFQSLKLPSYEAGPTQVETWLDERGFLKRQR
ncbi:unnamed protein product [Durusdinium trenchii]|uniref:Protein kinase domain-containing protein n=2 Tax=Durusdinium trenchii TaxID=1381693 RepID=A0ABP0R221_9DINO